MFELNFIKNYMDEGKYTLNFSPHFLELNYALGYWYPTIIECPEISSDDLQRVSLNRISTITQLQKNNIYHILMY